MLINKRISALVLTVSQISANPAPVWAQTTPAESSTLVTAAPFGVEIGKTTCRQAAAALKMTKHLLNLDSIPASAQVKPDGYPGADVFYVSCARGADTPVSWASLSISGSAREYDAAVSDLASKYKKIGPRELGGVVGTEFRARNGNVMVYLLNSYLPKPQDLLIEVRYSSFDSLELEERLEQQKKDAARAKEKARRDVL